MLFGIAGAALAAALAVGGGVVGDLAGFVAASPGTNLHLHVFRVLGVFRNESDFYLLFD